MAPPCEGTSAFHLTSNPAALRSLAVLGVCDTPLLTAVAAEVQRRISAAPRRREAHSSAVWVRRGSAVTSAAAAPRPMAPQDSDDTSEWEWGPGAAPVDDVALPSREAPLDGQCRPQPFFPSQAVANIAW